MAVSVNHRSRTSAGSARGSPFPVHARAAGADACNGSRRARSTRAVGLASKIAALCAQRVGPNAILVCGLKAIFNSFLSASARRPLHMRRRKGGRMSSRFTRVSDGNFRRTLQALRDTASVLAFPFKIFEEGPSLPLRKGESAYMHGDGKQANPRACHGEARFPAPCCELLLPLFVWRASMHIAGRKQRSLFL